MKLAIILIIALFGILALFLRIATASPGEVIITDADTVWAPVLVAADPDLTDSSDAPSFLLPGIFISHADTVWQPELIAALSEAQDSTDAPAPNLSDVFISHADTVWTPSLTVAPSGIEDSSDAPSPTLSEIFVSHADSIWSNDLKENGWEAPPIPTYNVAVILAEPNDVPHHSEPITAQPCKLLPEKTYLQGHNREYYQDLVYCVADYHKENSFGTVNLNFTIYDNNGEWFETDGQRDAITVATNKGIDLSKQDIVIIVEAGRGGDAYSGGGGTAYQIIEIDTSTGQIIDFSKILIGEKHPLGTWMHEVGHVIGNYITPQNTATPDLYKMGNVGKWDLMAEGAWNGGLFDILFFPGDGTNPPYMSSFTKEFLQWLNYDIHPKSAYGEYWINSLETSEFGDSVFRYNLSDDTNDESPKYYILEGRNRNLKTWDSSLPGLLVTGDKNLVLYYVDTKGLPKYGYDLEKHKAKVENWTVTIPGNNPLKPFEVNDGILNPLINETYRDLDNLVKFSAITDRTVNDKYEIQARIEEITYNSFSDNFWGVILRPKSTLKEKIKGIFHLEVSSEFHIANPDSKYLLGTMDAKDKNSNTITILTDKDWGYYMTLNLFGGIASLSFELFSLSVLLSIVCLVSEKKLLPRWKSERKKKIAKIIFRIIWIFTLITFFIFIIFSFITRYWESKKPVTEDLENLKTIANPSQTEFATLPDLDLHLYCADGKHVGINYETREYEIQIPEAIVSGDNQNSPEWIFVPKDITACRFVVSSYDNQKFLEENPDIAQEIEDATDSYEVYARYVYPETDIYTSTIIAEDIEPGAELEHKISGVHDIAIQSGVLIARINFDPDTFNLKSKGKVITAYVELPKGFDISQIDISSILLNGSVPALSEPIEIEDYNSNGIPDLMIKFNREEVQNVLNAKEEMSITITGLIFHNNNYLEFKGNDTIKVIDNRMKMAIKKGD